MTLKMQKPDNITSDVNDFIKGAAGEAAVREEISSGKKEKTFLLRLPHGMWKEAKLKAGENEQTLHDFIIDALKEKLLKA